MNMSHKTIGTISAILIFFCTTILTAYSFDRANTRKPIEAGEAILDECETIKQERKKIDCVAKSLEKVSRNIRHPGPGYKYIARTLNKTARAVRKSKTKSEAAKIISKTTAELKSAPNRPAVYAGPKKTAQKHFAQFAQYTKKARSVLRS